MKISFSIFNLVYFKGEFICLLSGILLSPIPDVPPSRSERNGHPSNYQEALHLLLPEILDCPLIVGLTAPLEEMLNIVKTVILQEIVHSSL
jgi:hypothetical protein